MLIKRQKEEKKLKIMLQTEQLQKPVNVLLKYYLSYPLLGRLAVDS